MEELVSNLAAWTRVWPQLRLSYTKKQPINIYIYAYFIVSM